MARDDEDETEGQSDQPTGALTTGPTRAGQIARRDFSGSSLTLTSPITEAIAASERAAIEARYIMAMRNPRQLDDVRVRVLAECRRPGFAEVATYSRPVGLEKNDTTGKWEEVFAEGLSIRFAEVALRNMGNMSCKATTLYDDSHVRMIRVTALDFETSGSWDVDLTIPKTTERRTLRKGQRPLSERVNSYGDRVYIVEANDQQVATKCAAEISKASRTAILRLVPGEIQDEAFEVCKKVAADRDAKDPRAAVKRVIDAFAELGIRPPQIVQWLGHDIETGSREEFLALSKVISGLRERELVWSEVLAERLAELAERAKGKPNGAAADKSAEAKPAENGKATAADAKPQDTAKPSAAQETKPAEAAKVAEPTKPVEPAKPKASSTGKGTAALKDKLTSSTPTPAADQKPATPPPQQQPLTLVPVSTDDYEMRNCAMCGVEIEVRKTDPQGTQCEACANA